ncbi:MAG TPA: PEP-CTERM sorting domain-containing protein [Proteobacteria bacterium]|nr:PEP-CTERM sorting domain-containing protein [Pseudomonadota bacterium]
MIRSVKILLVTLVISLFFAGQVGACPSGGHRGRTGHGCITIIDAYPNDKNIITSYSEITNCCDYPVFRVVEDYNEKYLTPYPSHDGYGIVNSNGDFFDKVVTFTNIRGGGSCTCSGNCGSGTCPCCGCSGNEKIWAFEFQVHNTSPYAWSDYHFEFWDKDFTKQYENLDLLTDWDSNIFQNSSFDGSILQFWAPNWQYPSQTSTFLLYMDLGEFAHGCCCTCGCDHCRCCACRSFGIRQVATTVPEPATMVLVGSGLLGVAAFRKLRKK